MKYFIDLPVCNVTLSTSEKRKKNVIQCIIFSHTYCNFMLSAMQFKCFLRFTVYTVCAEYMCIRCIVICPFIEIFT